jgi:hypothetical protein
MLCECGCGEVVPIAKRTRSERGQVKGQPLRFINGHNVRVLPAGEQQRRALGVYERFCRECGAEIPEGVASRVRYCSPVCKAVAMLREDKKRKTYAKWRGVHVHRQIAAQQPNFEPSNVVHHKDENKANNTPENLEVLLNQSAHCKAHNFGGWRRHE